MVEGIILTFLLVTNVILVAGQQTEINLSCPPDWLQLDGSCVQVFGAMFRWENAQETCLSVGGNLLKLVDFEMTQFAGELASDQDIESFWTGMRLGLSGAATWADNSSASVRQGFWSQGSPGEDEGCVYVSSLHGGSYLWSVAPCQELWPFICQRSICSKDSFHCARDACVPQSWVCDGMDDCGDFSEELNCSSKCSFHQRGMSGVISLDSQSSNLCRWLIEAPIGTNIQLNVSHISSPSGELLIFGGGRSEISSKLIVKVTHEDMQSLPMVIVSDSPYMLLIFHRSADNIKAEWQEVSALPTQTSPYEFSLVAGFQPSSITVPRIELGKQMFVWKLRAMSNQQLVTLMIDELSLLEGDMLVVRDGDTLSSPVLLQQPRPPPQPQYVTSTKNTLLVELTTNSYNPLRKLQISYKQGCNVTLTSDSAVITSPGNFQQDYPNYQTCTYTINSASEVTLYVDQVDIQDKDSLKLVMPGQEIGLSAPVSDSISVSDRDTVYFELTTNYIHTAKGFQVVYSKDCEKPWLNFQTVITPRMGRTYYRSMFSLSCLTGYQFNMELYGVGVDSIQIKCFFGGEWSIDVIPSCEPVYCGFPPTVENGYIESSTGVIYQGTVVYSCFDGYSLSSSDTITCQADSTWSNTPICSAEICPMLPPIGNGMVNVHGTTYSSILTYGCDVGYEILGADRLFCQSDNMWSNKPPSCMRVQCPLPKSPVNGARSNLTTARYNDRAYITCDPGYIPDGPSEIICQENQIFSKAGNCQDKDECAGANDCSGVSLCRNTPGSYYCDCPDGYSLNINKTDCLDIQECDLNAGCSHTCRDIPGSYLCECPPGYHLITEEDTEGYILPRQESGHRKGDVLFYNHTCVRVKCPSPPQVNSSHMLTDQMDYRYGDRVEYLCKLGYIKMSGSLTLQCQTNRLWTPDPPVCTEVFCEEEIIPGDVMNPAQVSPAGAVRYGESVNLTCIIPGLPEPVIKQRTCLYDQPQDQYHFYGADFECGFIDCGKPEIVNGGYSQLIDDENKTTFGSRLVLNCRPLFSLDGMSTLGNGTVQCESSGHWGFNTLRCLGETCPGPGRPADATQMATSYEEGSTVTYRCDRLGFELNDPSPLRCELNEDGTELVWNRPVPKCIDITPPSFDICTEYIEIEEMSKAGFDIPLASDNSGFVRELRVSPPGFSPDQPLSKSVNVTYTTFDGTGLNASCRVVIHVRDPEKPSIECPASVEILYTAGSISVDLDDSLVQVSGVKVTLHLRPEKVFPGDIGKTLTGTASVVDRYNRSADCQFQISVKATQCDANQIGEPVNGTKDCERVQSVLQCFWTCNSGFTFYEDSSGGRLMTECSDNTALAPNWTRTLVPQCVFNGDDAILTDIYKMTYESNKVLNDSCLPLYQDHFYNLTISKEISDATVICKNQFDEQISINLYPKGGIEVHVNGTEAVFTFGIQYLPKIVDAVKLEYCPGLLKGTIVSLKKSLINGTENCTDLTVKEASSIQLTSSFICPDHQKLRVEQDNYICLNCPPGTFISKDSTCELCPLGRYQSAEGQNQCEACPPNTLTYQEGSTSINSCIDICAPGWSSETGLPPCAQCAKNSYWLNSTSCLPCPPDSATTIPGAVNIESCLDACAPGEYSVGMGLVPCESCPQGYYQNKQGQESCVECPSGETTPNTTATQSQQCVSDNILCSSLICLNSGDCKVRNHRAYCDCEAGYTGERCESIINHCLSQPCYYGNNCTALLNGYKCSCDQPDNPCVEGPVYVNRYEMADLANLVSEVIQPAGFNLTHPVLYDTSLTYRAIGQDMLCQIDIIVQGTGPLELMCPEYIVEVLSDGGNRRTLSLRDKVNVTEGAFLNFSPSDRITISSTELDKVKKVSVAASLNQQQATCIFQVFIKGEKCSERYVRTPVNGQKSCSISGNITLCTLSCHGDSGYKFEDGSAVKNVTCDTDSGWLSVVPQCVLIVPPPADIQVFDLLYTVSDRSDFPMACLESPLVGQVERCAGQFVTAIRDNITCADSLDIHRENLDYIITNNQVTVGVRVTYVTPPNMTCMSSVEQAFQSWWTDQSVCGFIIDLSKSDVSCPAINFTSFNLSSEQCTLGSRIIHSNCVPCPPGTKYENRRCVACPLDTYNDKEAAVDCASCESNKKTTATGSVDEDQCIDGCSSPLHSQSGFPPCSPCPKDYYYVNQTYCEKCPSGTGTWDTGTRSEFFCTEPCGLGWYSYTGLMPCYPCPPNHYQDSIRQQQCLMCPENTTTTITGAKSLADCVSTESVYCEQEGYCLNEGSCELIGNGYQCRCSPGFTGVQCQIEELFYGDNCEMERDNCRGENKCENGGMCQDQLGNSTCLCTAGYSGPRCSDQVSICEQRPCDNGGTCQNLTVRRVCLCPAGFTGVDCEENIDDCISTPCLFGGNCMDAVDSFSCNCSAGYTGEVCERRLDLCGNQTCNQGGFCVDNHMEDRYQCVCQDGFNSDLNETTCAENDTCVNNNPCSPDGSSQCRYLGSGDITCVCKRGYQGSLCQHNTDDCLSKPCQNSATCLDGVNKYSCLCQPGFTGADCQTDINDCDDVCVEENYLNCTDRVNDYYCECKPGFTGKNCSVNVNECDSIPCQHGGTCLDQVNKFKCECPEGWKGDRCERTINKCQPNPCLNQGECVPTFNNYLCKCSGNITLGGPCEYAPSGCNSIEPCLHGGRCMDSSTTTTTCSCSNQKENVCRYQSVKEGMNSGASSEIPRVFLPTECERLCNANVSCQGFLFNYTRSGCFHFSSIGTTQLDTCCDFHQKDNCSDNLLVYSGDGCEIQSDPFTQGVCQNGGTARLSLTGGLTCSCKNGYTGSVCETNIDDCLGKPCVGGECIDAEVRAFCRCPIGWTGTNCNTVIDEDFDLYFYSGSKSGEASLPYPITVNLQSFTLSLWVRFKPGTSGTFFMIFSLPSLNSLGMKSEVLRLDSDGATLTLPGIETDTLLFQDYLRISDGRWHLVTVIIELLSNPCSLRLTADGVNMQYKSINCPLIKPNSANVWLTLGNLYDTMLELPVSGAGFNGYISQVRLYNRAIDFHTELTPISRNTSALLPGAVLRWAEFELFPGVQRIDGSSVTASDDQCTSGFTGKQCEIPINAGRSLPHLSSCPVMVEKYSKQPVTQVSWTPPTVSQDIMLNSNYRNGVSLQWGRYLVVYEAQNSKGHSATCSFILHVKNDMCNNLLGPDAGDTARTTYLSYTNFELMCNDSYRISQTTPDFYTCGPSGNIDPRSPAKFIPYRFPACGAYVSEPKQKLTLELKYTLSDCKTDVTNAVKAKVLARLITLNEEVNYELCPTKDCETGVNITTRCESNTGRRKKRQVNGMVVIIQMNNINSTVTRDGEQVPPRVLFDTDINSFNDDDFKNTAPQLKLDEGNYLLETVPQCPQPQTLVNNECVLCGRGYQYNNTDGMCEACPAGAYKDDTLETCQMCGLGQTTLTSGCPSDSDCKPSCSRGQYYSETQLGCIECFAGTYQSDEGQFMCIPCPLGKTTPANGADSLEQCYDKCSGGEELNGTGDCVPCSVGYYRPPGEAFSSCQKCPMGFVTPNTSSIQVEDCNVVDCPAGSIIVGTSCEDCPLGSYQPEPYKLSCIECGEGNSTTATKSTRPEDCIEYCPSGVEKVGNVCVMCPRGWYKDNSNGLFSQCVMCKEDYITESEGSVSGENCTVGNCSAGYFLTVSNRCEACPVRTYQPEKWTLSCINCSDHFTTEKNSSVSVDLCNILSCNLGYEEKNGSCLPCKIGYFKDTYGKDSCQVCAGFWRTAAEGAQSQDDCLIAACPPGQFSVSNKCRECPLGFYQPDRWKDQCISCSPDYTTFTTGTSDPSLCLLDCEAGSEYQFAWENCTLCERGFYRNKTDPFNPKCVSCPIDRVTPDRGASDIMDCTVGNCSAGTYWNESSVRCENCRKGSYQPEKWMTECIECSPDTTTEGEGTVLLDDCLAVCVPGYGGSGGVCDICPRGTFKEGDLAGTCKTCPDGSTTATTGTRLQTLCNQVACGVGSRRNPNSNVCEECDYGYYQDKIWQDSCERCPNSFSATLKKGSTERTDCVVQCPDGSYYNPVFSQCEDCEVGSYRDGSDLTQITCTPCSNGLITPTHVTQAKNEGFCIHANCTVPGTYRNPDPNINKCEACPIGSYQGEKWKDSCEQCDVGLTTLLTGSSLQTDCIKYCPSGQVLEGNRCEACPRGTYKNNAENVFGRCIPCDEKYITADVGSTSALDCNQRNCSAGYYRKVLDNGQESCEVCKTGTYQPEKWQTECIDCQPGFSTNDAGATDSAECLILCAPGESISDGASGCSSCLRGTYSNGGAAATCVVCPDGFTTPTNGATQPSDCSQVACSPGDYLTRTNTCKPCPRGKYQPQKWASECLSCDPGETTLTEGADTAESCVESCPAGSRYEGSSRSCVLCERGFYRITGSPQVSCVPCPSDVITEKTGSSTSASCFIANCTAPGTYRNPETNSCEACSVGFYQTAKWQDSCLPCQEGLTTRETGASSCIHVCDVAGYCMNEAVCQRDSLPHCRCLSAYEGDKCDTRKDAGLLGGDQTMVIVGSTIGAAIFIIVLVMISIGVCLHYRRKNHRRLKKAESASIMGAPRLVTNPYFYGDHSMAGSIDLNRSYLKLGQDENVDHNFVGFQNPVLPEEDEDVAVYTVSDRNYRRQ